VSPPALTPEQQRGLLALARRAIERRLLERCETEAPAAEIPEQLEGGLGPSCGAFVTIRRRDDGELRGCVGFLEGGRSLAEAVCLAAAAAATEDRRFDPVTSDELADLRLEISVLGRLEPLAPELLEIGRHGVVVRHAGRSGLLLPQVAAERGWDRETFLDQTCRKAGLAPGSWREPGADVLAFTAVVFAESYSLQPPATAST
jgi:AmmeMemoRadiSam system protein A